MKKFILTYSLLLISTCLFAQDITGQWNGVLNVMGSQLELVFHIEKTDSSYSATFDSPDQGAMDIPFSSASFNGDTLRLTAANISAVYKGTPKADSLIGTWSQGGQSFPLNMSRDEVKKEEPRRPQEPEKPYPYYEEEVTFKNEKDSLTLAGTLTMPEKTGAFPAVILISGSGPQNRNEELLGHKPFLVLADYLTRNGIAVLRYDDRGTAESTGNHSTATSKDFASDVMSAIEYLKSRESIDPDNIGLIGHSEGGLIAPMVANNTDNVAFIVMLAGTGVPGREISLMQARTLQGHDVDDQEAYNRFLEKAIEIASSDKDIDVLKKELTEHYRNSQDSFDEMIPQGTSVDSYIAQQVEASLRPWVRFFYNHDPAKELRNLTIPILSLIGTNDVQVPAEMNHPPIRKALEEAGNKNYTIKELEGLNHLFQESKTGAPQEYAQIEQTISPVALEEISTWIKKQVKR